MSNEKHARKIRIIGDVVVFFGLLTAISAFPALNGIYAFFAHLVIWPADDLFQPFYAETRLTQAIMGGIFTGFGVMWYLAGGALFQKAPDETLKLLFWGATTWFVTDSTASVLAGAAGNVPPNVGFYVLLLWSLKAPKSVEQEKSQLSQ